MGRFLRPLIGVTDMMAVILAIGITCGVELLLGRGVRQDELEVFLFCVPLWVIVGVVGKLYYYPGRRLVVSAADEFGSVLRVATAWSWIVLLIRSLVGVGPTELLMSVTVWVLSVPSVVGLRALVRALGRRRGLYGQSVLIVGRPDGVRCVADRIQRHPEWAIEVVEELDLPRNPADSIGAAGMREANGGGVRAGRFDYARARVASGIVDKALSTGVSRVIFATTPEDLELRTNILRQLIECGVQVDVIAGDLEVLRASAELNQIEGLPVISMPPGQQPRSLRAMKRFADLLLAVPSLFVVSPFFLTVALCIKWDSPGPVLYRQERVGRSGQRFKLVKFRTMTADADERQNEVADLNMHGSRSVQFKAARDPRVTGMGAWLRRYSLDELPQLWNVIKGDMSLVGPRPMQPCEDEQITRHYAARRDVRPGITGPWQVMGRSEIPFDEMLKLDYSYVWNWSLTGDLKLLAETASAIARGQGAY